MTLAPHLCPRRLRGAPFTVPTATALPGQPHIGMMMRSTSDRPFLLLWGASLRRTISAAPSDAGCWPLLLHRDMLLLLRVRRLTITLLLRAILRGPPQAM